MTELPNNKVAKQLFTALENRDLNAFGKLLAEDVRWGDDSNPKKCRSREEAITTFKRLLDQGVDGEIESITATPNGILCKFKVKTPNENDNTFRTLYHLYKTTGDAISEILPFESRSEAELAAELR